MFKKHSWVLVLFFTLIPFIIVSFFNLPMGDDFYFGDVAAKNDVSASVSYWYNNWGGRYSQEVLLTIFNPLSYGSLDFFWLPPLVLTFLICFVVFILIKCTANNKLENKDLLITYSLILFLIFNLMPEIGETLYWISGAYTFQSGNIFFILQVATIIQLNKKNSFFKAFFLIMLSTILCFLIAGTNEIIMAYQFGFSIMYLIFCIFSKNRNLYIALLLFAFICIASYFSIFAPGNLVRASATGRIFHSFPKAIIESIVRGSFYLIFWLPSSLLIAIFIWKQLGLVANNFPKKETTNKEFYIAITLFFAIVFAGFFPSLLATGWNPPRTVAPIFIVYLFLFFGILLYFYTFINEAIALKYKNFIFDNKILLLIIILALSNKHNVMNAYVDIFSLKVVKYSKQINAVYSQLASSQKDTIFVTPLDGKPASLPIRWPDHYNTLVNSELERYFDKKVLMKPTP